MKNFWEREKVNVIKDLKGDLELHVKFEAFQMKASREQVNDQELFSVIEGLGNEIIKHDTDELLKQAKVNVDGKDRRKIGGELIIQVKYLGRWMMKVQSKSSLEGWKEKLMKMIFELQRNHDKIKQGDDTGIIRVYDDKVFGDGYES